MSVRGLANSSTKQYCITYSGQVQGRVYTRSVTIREKFPPTQFRAFTAARNDFQQFARRMGSIVNVEVTNIAFGACAGSGGGGGGGGGGGTTPISPGTLADLMLWLKADADVFSDAGITPATNGQEVIQWNDQSGAGRNVSRHALVGPTYLTNIINGLPSIRFPSIVIPAAAACLSRTVYALSQPISVMMVVRFNGVDGGDVFGNRASSFNSMPQPGFGRNYNAVAPVVDGLSHIYNNGTGNPSGPAISADTFHIVQVYFNGAGSSIIVDGVSSATLNAGAGSFSGVTLGSSGYNGLGNGSYFRGDLPEIVHVNRILSASEIAGVVAYFQQKYAL